MVQGALSDSGRGIGRGSTVSQRGRREGSASLEQARYSVPEGGHCMVGGQVPLGERLLHHVEVALRDPAASTTLSWALSTM